VLPPHCRRVADCIFELDQDFLPGMQVPVRFIADRVLLRRWLESDQLQQLIDLAALPGGAAPVVGLPNLNQGDATPSGAVAATHYPEGFLVPSAVGPDINCGLRLLSSSLNEQELAPRLAPLLDQLELATPVGTDRGGPLTLSPLELEELLKEGCRYLVREKGIGTDDDLDRVPFEGHFHEAHGEHLSASAKGVGRQQLGTLGSGRSHFAEVGTVEEIFDTAAAEQLGLAKNQVTVLIHAGARELGERTYQELVKLCDETIKRRHLPARRGLSYIPLDSEEGLWCYHAHRAAANYAWANRHVLTHQTRAAFRQVFSDSASKLRVTCDCPSNTVSLERMNGEIVCLHRHAATSAHPPGEKEHLPRSYHKLGEPFVLPGSMGSSSYVLVATAAAEELSLASACHGAGRLLSRKSARKVFAPHELKEYLAQRGVVARSPETPELREQVPQAYRDAEVVLTILERAGVARRVARLRPRAVLKG
jgi:tRNA-splicing ligase RtcB (3'-phosphate/5'-hydroxy nucleic acid ligase)